MTCPECGSARVYGVHVWGSYDGPLYLRCDCGHTWHRFPEGDPLRARAAQYVDAANARRTA